MKKISNNLIIVGIILVLGVGFYLLSVNGFLSGKKAQPVAENKIIEPQQENKPAVAAPATKVEADSELVAMLEGWQNIARAKAGQDPNFLMGKIEQRKEDGKTCFVFSSTETIFDPYAKEAFPGFTMDGIGSDGMQGATQGYINKVTKVSCILETREPIGEFKEKETSVCCAEVSEVVENTPEKPLVNLLLSLPIDPLQALVDAKFNAYYAIAKKYGGTVSYYPEPRQLFYTYGSEAVGSHNKTQEIKDKKCFQYIQGTRSGQQQGVWYDMYLNDFGSGEATTFGTYQMVDIKKKIVCEILNMSGADWAMGQERTEGEYICCGYYTLNNPEIIRDPKTMAIIKQ